MKRRRFFSSPLKSLALVFAAGLPYGIGRIFLAKDTSSKADLSSESKTSHRKIRPPGALLDDLAFQKSCIHCNLCAEICPPTCIKFYSANSGNNSNTPYIEPADTACTLCGKCMEVCPTDALSITKITDIQMGQARIERLACYPWMDTGVCGACVSICPLGERAISFEFANIYRPVVLDGCVGCGLCVEVCPHPSLPIRVV